MDITNCNKTALHMACLRGHEDCVKILLDAGASVLSIDEDGTRLSIMHFMGQFDYFESIYYSFNA